MWQEEYDRELTRIGALELTYGEKLALSTEAMARLSPRGVDRDEVWEDRECDHCGRRITKDIAATCLPPNWVCMVVDEALPTCWDLVVTWGEPMGSRRPR